MIKIFLFLILLPLNFYAHADGHALKSKPVINLSVAKVMANACEEDQKKKWLQSNKYSYC